jgi:hypothetical protein
MISCVVTPFFVVAGEIADRSIIIAYSQFNLWRLVDIFIHLKLPKSKDWGKLKAGSTFE